MNNFSANGTLRLGTLQKEYGCARKFVWSSLVFGPLLVLAAFALAALPVWWLLSNAKMENPALTLSLMELAAFVSFALGIVVLVKLYKYRNMRVQIFERGLAYLTGGRMQTFAWDEVESYHAESTRIYINGIPSGTTHKHTLQKANGERLVLSQRTAGIEEVADRIAREIFVINYRVP